MLAEEQIKHLACLGIKVNSQGWESSQQRLFATSGRKLHYFRDVYSISALGGSMFFIER